MALCISHHVPMVGCDSVVVFLHGFASIGEGEKAYYLRARVLETQTAFVTFDFTGHGNSPGTMGDLTVSQLIEDCREVIVPLAGEYRQIHVIGSSMGACAAAWFTVRYPGYVDRAAFIAPAFRFVDQLTRSLGSKERAQWKRTGVLRFRNEYCDVELGYELLRDWAGYPEEELLAKYATPGIIVHGMNDELISYRDSVEFFAGVRASSLELLVIKEGDHRLTDHVERVADVILPVILPEASRPRW